MYNNFEVKIPAKVDEQYLNLIFAEYGFNFTHDDNLREDAQFFFCEHEKVPKKSLYLYAAAQERNNLTNKAHVREHYLSGILCFRSEDFYNHGIDRDKAVVAFMPEDSVSYNGYVNFSDDLTSIEEVAEIMYNRLLDVSA